MEQQVPVTTKKSNDCDLPEDIKREWLDFIRALQAACSDNQGYGLLTITVAVNKNVPLLWRVPSAEKLNPRALSDEKEIVVAPHIVAALAAMMTG